MLRKCSLNRRTGRSRGTAGLAVGGVMLAGGLFLAGCSGSTSSSSGASGVPARAAPPAAGEAAPAPNGAAGSAAGQRGGAGTTARLAPGGSIIYTAQLTVRAKDVGSASATAAQIAAGAGGYVSNETSSASPDDPSRATASVQLKIPV